MIERLADGDSRHESDGATTRLTGPAPDDRESNERPKWDSVNRELRFRGEIVKRFNRGRALNQELVLAAFEELQWPSKIDDPIPPKPGVSINRRLSDTIRALNRHQKNELIKFRGDGTGEAVKWEPVLSS